MGQLAGFGASLHVLPALYLLVFAHPARLSVTAAYDVQSVALLLACALRYSSTPPGPERAFFRNLGAYLLAYGVLSSVGNRMELVHQEWADLCWSMPLLLFCTLVLLTHKNGTQNLPQERSLKIGLPTHLQGLSALGLAFLSITAATLFQDAHHDAGLLALAIALLLLAVRTSARESQLTGAHESLQHAAHHDALTGLANRAYLLEEMSHRLGHAGAEVGVLFLDLDGFKNINDSLGHPFGDRLLVQIAVALCGAVGPGDLVVRLGGDEFVILTDCNGAARSPEQLAALLVEQLRQPIFLEGRVLYLSASVGIARGVAGQGANDLLRDADCAMYEAKRLGKNQEQSFRQDMVSKASEQLALEQDLRQAIAADDLVCHYQPIYSVSEESIVGFEALSRWNHARRGSVSPVDFIPVAEETGLIIELGKRVLLQACEQVQRWNQMYGRRYTMSVNLCARQFADPELLSSIRAALASTGLDPTLLKLEITESALLSGVDGVEAVLNGARALGIQISLDDFGTGYSSLSYLLKLPFDVIKIDRSFVQALDQDPKRAELVRTILMLAAGLEKNVIAEGVETKEERDWLARMQCDLLQGFYFSKPLPAGQIDGLLGGLVRQVAGRPAPVLPAMLLGGIRPPYGELRAEVGAG